MATATQHSMLERLFHTLIPERCPRGLPPLRTQHGYDFFHGTPRLRKWGTDTLQAWARVVTPVLRQREFLVTHQVDATARLGPQHQRRRREVKRVLGRGSSGPSWHLLAHCEAQPCYARLTMETLKRAATETFRQLGVNILTLVTVIVGFGLTIIIVRNLSTPETDSVTDVVLWFAKSIAWLLSVIVIFIPLVALNTFKVRASIPKRKCELKNDCSDRRLSGQSNEVVSSHIPERSLVRSGQVLCVWISSQTRSNPRRRHHYSVQIFKAKPCAYFSREDEEN